MTEIMGHWPGRIFLLFLLATIILMSVAISMGVTEIPEGSDPVLLFGWMTMPLVIGVLFVLAWLAAYLVYFFKFWPFR